jgi:hypothetical protein
VTQRTASITVTLPQRPNRAIVQEVVAQLPWRQNIALNERFGHVPAGRQERFPGDFMFQLTAAEAAVLRSQTVTLKPGRGRHRKYLPYAFTEQGVAMLSRRSTTPNSRWSSTPSGSL